MDERHPDAIVAEWNRRNSLNRAKEKAMSDTPRTDAATWVTGEGADQDEVVHADFARQLERELAYAKERQVPDAPQGYRHELVKIG